MPPERVTIVVHSSIGEDGPLTVQDGLRQVLDFFDWLSASFGAADRAAVAWDLAAIKRESPLHATGEAMSLAPGVDANDAARRAKAVIASEIATLTNGRGAPLGMAFEARALARSMMMRNLNGISRTDIFLFEGQAPIVITEKVARAASFKLDEADLVIAAGIDDSSRNEMGSVEGRAAEPTTYYGRPAIRIRERISGKWIVCVLSTELARQVGPSHKWEEAWSNQRVLVTGEILYGRDGLATRVNDVSAVTFIEIRPYTYEELAMPRFTGGVTPPEYLDWLWRGDGG